MFGEEMPCFWKLNLDHLWISLDKIHGDFDLPVCLFIYDLYLTYFHLRLESFIINIWNEHQRSKTTEKRREKCTSSCRLVVIKLGSSFNSASTVLISEINLCQRSVYEALVLWQQMQLCVYVGGGAIVTFHQTLPGILAVLTLHERTKVFRG